MPTREIFYGVTETRRGRDERPDATELAAYLIGMTPAPPFDGKTPCLCNVHTGFIQINARESLWHDGEQVGGEIALMRGRFYTAMSAAARTGEGFLLKKAFP